MRNMAVSWCCLSACALLTSLTGCTALSDCKYEIDQKIRTHQAWGEFDGCHDQCFTCDYSTGWKAGFYDVATGGTGCPPVFAPKRYWKPPVFCEYDPCRRDEWYAGFQDGAAYAKCQPDHHYLRPYLPPQNCCPVQAASCPQVIDECTDFPIEHIRGDHDYLAPPIDTLDSADPAINGPIAPAEMPPELNPQQDTQAPESGEKSPEENAPAAPSSSEAYEKDPAPATTANPASVDTTLQQRLVRQYQEQLRKQASAGRESLLERLVLNAAETTDEAGQ